MAPNKRTNFIGQSLLIRLRIVMHFDNPIQVLVNTANIFAISLRIANRNQSQMTAGQPQCTAVKFINNSETGLCSCCFIAVNGCQNQQADAVFFTSELIFRNHHIILSTCIIQPLPDFTSKIRRSDNSLPLKYLTLSKKVAAILPRSKSADGETKY